MTRYFWIYSDGKTIKEISYEEYFAIYKNNLTRRNKIHLLRVHKNDLYLPLKYITRTQIEKVLVETEGGV